MKKPAFIPPASWLPAGPSAKAGGFVSGDDGKAKGTPSASILANPPGVLDAESPAQARFHGRRSFGSGRGFGHGRRR